MHANATPSHKPDRPCEIVIKDGEKIDKGYFNAIKLLRVDYFTVSFAKNALDGKWFGRMQSERKVFSDFDNSIFSKKSLI